MMKAFTLQLYSATEHEEFADVTSFVGEDASGSFGILAGHLRCVTSLVFGLARFRRGGDDWQYLALPGGLLYFLDNRLQIYSRSYLLDSDYERISTLLRQQLLAEEQSLHQMRESMRRMEESILRRLWEVGRRRVQD
ncbi:F0F1 ATP synthase subunit epsilon [Microbulbifer marinus]|uniref:ATP synthase epsilon chain n=1 Tax=Microbulbifer marinus TaxID=658218 RepID=A0A1H3W3M6_9GAMM|nr:F0F1 ATP synthase subunit epsilon [Microbulbifer marinus]SDZ80952.1 F-type H+-transporting ATPase subunit epsilon [Microbulbifer marinus]